MPYNHKHNIKYKKYDKWIAKEIWTLIPRVTEVCGVITCMFPAWQNDVNRTARGEEPLNIQGANYASLRGTLTHYPIQEFIDGILEVETEPLELSANDNKLLANLKKMDVLDDLYDEVASGVDTFIKWWEMYNPIPLVSEQEIVMISQDENGRVDPTKSLKGTMDFIAEIHIDELSKTAYQELKYYSKKEDFEILNDKFTTIIDWKSGKDAWKSHQLQLTAYDMLVNDGWWEEAERTGLITQPPLMRSLYGFEARYGMCVKTGGKRPLTTIYDVGEHKDFFLAWDLFNNPEATTYSQTQKKSTGLKRICMFCEYRNNGCPLFSWSKQGEIQLT